jgi:hypothetical protein
MDEIVPVILGAVCGALSWRFTAGRLRVALAILTVLVVGPASTLASGEFVLGESWIYFLIDFAEAAVGLALGLAFAHFLLPARSATAPSSVRR